MTIPEAGVVPRVPHESLLQKPARPSHAHHATTSVSAPKPLVQYSKPSAAAIAAKAKARGAGKAKAVKAHSALYSVLSEKLLLTGQRMTVVQADIASIQVDAIVHPTSSSYSLAGEIGSALAKVGGTVFAQELRNMEKDNGPIDLNGCMLSFICTPSTLMAPY